MRTLFPLTIFLHADVWKEQLCYSYKVYRKDKITVYFMPLYPVKKVRKIGLEKDIVWKNI